MQPFDKRNRQADAANLWDMVKIDFQPVIIDQIDQPRKIRKQPLIAHTFEIEGWQRHYASASEPNGMLA